MNATVSDRDLQYLNDLLPWIQQMQLPDGRLLGNGRFKLVGWHDPRVVEFMRLYPVNGKRILETGCLEGVMTCALCEAGAHVTSVDVRVTCVVKTFARTLAHGYNPKILLHDIRRIDELGQFDAVFHSGVFNHLDNPVDHFRRLRNVSGRMFLDTHVARPDLETKYVEGYSGTWIQEYGWEDDLSGTTEKSFWLDVGSLHRLFKEDRWEYKLLSEDLENPHGPRRAYWLSRQ